LQHKLKLFSQKEQIKKTAKSPISISQEISATRLSQGDPIGFPSHPRGWFSIIVYLVYFMLVCLLCTTHTTSNQKHNHLNFHDIITTNFHKWHFWDNQGTRIVTATPMDFSSHLHEWFSIVVQLAVFQSAYQLFQYSDQDNLFAWPALKHQMLGNDYSVQLNFTGPEILPVWVKSTLYLFVASW